MRRVPNAEIPGLRWIHNRITIGADERRNISWEGATWAVKRGKSWADKTQTACLLAAVEKHAPASPQHRFPTRRVAKHVRGSQPRSEVVPCRLPQWRSLWRYRQRIQTGTLQRVGHQSPGDTWRRVHFPTQPHRQRQSLRHSPFILRKRGKVPVKGVRWRVQVKRRARRVVLHISLAEKLIPDERS